MVLTKLLLYYWDATQHPQQHFLSYEQNQQVNVSFSSHRLEDQAVGYTVFLPTLLKKTFWLS